LLRVRMATEQRRPATDRIFLVGFMGAGKTTVGQLLAQRLGWSFVDLDDRVRAREGREIAEIFRDSGETYFRQVESECLRELIAQAERGLVVALGGGAFVQAGNAAMLRETGVPVIFLDAAVHELRRRCAGTGDERPLFRDENQFRQLYEARRGGYMAADFRLDTGGKMPEQVVDELVALALSF
jgi:shikimate kinase